MLWREPGVMVSDKMEISLTNFSPTNLEELQADNEDFLGARPHTHIHIHIHIHIHAAYIQYATYLWHPPHAQRCAGSFKSFEKKRFINLLETF
ncbi:hypothetical protein [Prevotella sp. OH937_COT-195]|uniref:hypothetical protein n=1 Tax=Prevotella sp. OH937_COT-195 TaxID=2491051 RepID=UPI000F6496AB|nr:hypothetical protein [Prevotella sp. OH937_COT-195]RRD02674.1 hypothetical protein EII32_01270 [Prevotella sp. OH937_COT-195]